MKYVSEPPPHYDSKVPKPRDLSLCISQRKSGKLRNPLQAVLSTVIAAAARASAATQEPWAELVQGRTVLPGQGCGL